MILVNNPGDWGHVYAPLLHAPWHGCTLTDLVFPFFLFIVGVSIVLSRDAPSSAGEPRERHQPRTQRILRRGLLLMALGLFLAGYPFGLFGPRSFERLLETWRFPGVLQRIALCYVAAALLFERWRHSASALRLIARARAWAWSLLLVYAALITRVPVPGIGAPDLASKSDHLPGWLDRTLLGAHVWSSAKVYDPEGILSTVPAIATTLFGVLAGLTLIERSSTNEKTIQLLVRGTGLAAIGTVWSWFLPLNKALWTSSYAVLTAGFAYLTLGLSVWAFDRIERPVYLTALGHPLRTFGLNAITVFVGSGVLAKTLLYLKPGGRSLHAWIYGSLFSGWLPAHVASLAFAISWVALWLVVLSWMERRAWILKV